MRGLSIESIEENLANFSFDIKKWLETLYISLLKNDNFRNAYRDLKISDNLKVDNLEENYRNDIMDSLTKIIPQYLNWDIIDILLPELFQKLIENFLICLKNDTYIIFTLDDLHLLFQESLNRIEKPVDAKLEYKISHKTFNLIIEYLEKGLITPKWIDISYWKKYYYDIPMSDSGIVIKSTLRKLILLAKLKAKLNNRLKVKKKYFR